MKRVVMATVLSGLVLGLAWSAATQTASPDMIQDLCIRTDAQMAPALAKADAAGWASLAKSAAPIPPSAGFTLDDYRVRLQVKGSGGKVLVVGRGRVQSGARQLPADVCIVSQKPMDVAQLDRFKAWLAVDPFMSMDIRTLYMFADTPEGHKAFAPGEAGRAVLLSGKAKMAVIVTQPDVLTLGYIKLYAPTRRPDAQTEAKD